MSPDKNHMLPKVEAIKLDVALVLKRSLQAYVTDFTGVVLIGCLLVILPGVITRSIAASGDFDALLMTLRSILAMLYVAIVSWGLVSRQGDRAMSPSKFICGGLARAQPGLQVALLVGAAIVVGLTLHLFARQGTTPGWMLNVLLIGGGLLSACIFAPLVAVAVVERLGPVAAFRRTAELTEGNRNRILATLLVMVLTLAPSAALFASFAGDAGIWIRSLFEFFAWSFAAVVPAMVYAGLSGDR
jgi:hypothetical protein